MTQNLFAHAHHNPLAPKWSAPTIPINHSDNRHNETSSPRVEPEASRNLTTNNEDFLAAAAEKIVPNMDERRRHLFFHLSKLFPAQLVLSVMCQNSHEYDAQMLCQAILAQNSMAPKNTQSLPH